MPFSISSAPGRLILTLERSVTVRHAQSLAAELRGHLQENTSVTVNTEHLEDVDTCVLQLLCSLRKAVPVLSFESPSEALLGAAERCGLQRELLGGREGL